MIHKIQEMGSLAKKIKGHFDEQVIKIPRDRNSEFEPQIIKKHQRDISELEEKVILMYGKRFSNRDISETIHDIYGFNLDPTTISKITDAVQKDIEEFKNKGLEKIYPFIFIDGIRFKTREDGYSKEVSVYIVLGINLEGRKEVIGFYIGEYETSKMLLNVLNNIKIRGC